jgi:hypothetical protein
MKLGPGFHISGDTRGDAVGLTPEEVAEERAATGAPARRPRGPRNGSRRAPAVRNPFDEILKSLGLWDRVQEVCREHGVLPLELASESKTRRLHTVRVKVYGMLQGLGWCGADIAKLFERDESSVYAALRPVRKRA